MGTWPIQTSCVSGQEVFASPVELKKVRPLAYPLPDSLGPT